MLIETILRTFSDDRTVIADLSGSEALSPAGLRLRIAGAVHHFNACGIGRGDAVALLLPNSIDYAVVLLALWEMNCIIVPLNTRINESKAAYLCAHAGARFLVTSRLMRESNPWLQNVASVTVVVEDAFGTADPVSASGGEDRDAEATKLLLYTSGTTGNPKGVMLSRAAVEQKLRDLITLMPYAPGDVFLSFLPFSSGHGMIPGLLAPLTAGCTVYVAEFAPFLVPVFWDRIEAFGIHYFTSVPSVLQLLKDNTAVRPDQIRSLKGVFSASATLPSALAEWYHKTLGIEIRNCYGLTETASWVAVPLPEDGRLSPSCVGRPVNAEIRVFDGHGNRCHAGMVGEIRIKSPSVMSGYYRNPDETAAALSGGYVLTGDLGYVDEQGFLFLAGRKKHLIIRKGINIYPCEVDEAFSRHPAVRESASFGVPDERYGEKLVTALVSATPQAGTETYLEFARRELPVYLLPDDIFIVNALPRGETGKVLIEELRKEYRSVKQ